MSLNYSYDDKKKKHESNTNRCPAVLLISYDQFIFHLSFHGRLVELLHSQAIRS